LSRPAPLTRGSDQCGPLVEAVQIEDAARRQIDGDFRIRLSTRLTSARASPLISMGCQSTANRPSARIRTELAALETVGGVGDALGYPWVTWPEPLTSWLTVGLPR
jgi:hypothetical protein